MRLRSMVARTLCPSCVSVFDMPIGERRTSRIGASVGHESVDIARRFDAALGGTPSHAVALGRHAADARAATPPHKTKSRHGEP
ncbi:hypothetical protein QZM22_28660 [Burkholderia oklahomensis]|uniref:hypothetical protein n=1 Tax=Burkholderia oklahomensis TaxID=342113 RepID=UPI00265652CC|nr:hypothetical protein [Burkholderia oklahomensis]MDN7676360.1 hypothetical protein [Burkholderia oklahomensis]